MFLAAQFMPLGVAAQGTPRTSAPVNQSTLSSTMPSGSSSSKNLNFSSTQATVAASRAGTITVGGQVGATGLVQGGTVMSITPGTLLTPAMNAALWQSITGGNQHLLLNAAGAATGGAAKVNSSWASNLSSLVVPQGVTVNAVGFNASHPLNIAGAANILGSVYTLQNSAGLTAVLNAGSNLNIGSAGLLSGNLPANCSASFQLPK